MVSETLPALAITALMLTWSIGVRTISPLAVLAHRHRAATGARLQIDRRRRRRSAHADARRCDQGHGVGHRSVADRSCRGCVRSIARKVSAFAVYWVLRLKSPLATVRSVAGHAEGAAGATSQPPSACRSRPRCHVGFHRGGLAAPLKLTVAPVIRSLPAPDSVEPALKVVVPPGRSSTAPEVIL